eukprot:4555114-Prymnesium_polylepis.1
MTGGIRSSRPRTANARGVAAGRTGVSAPRRAGVCVALCAPLQELTVLTPHRTCARTRAAASAVAARAGERALWQRTAEVGVLGKVGELVDERRQALQRRQVHHAERPLKDVDSDDAHDQVARQRDGPILVRVPGDAELGERALRHVRPREKEREAHVRRDPRDKAVERLRHGVNA